MFKSLLFTCILFSFTACNSSKVSLDYLIKAARVYEGNGKEAYTTDLGIKGEKIVFLGNARRAKYKAKELIQAEGYILSPGFIDVHTHSLGDLLNQEKKANLNYLMQGVTTVVCGNDGRGPINVGQTLAKMDVQGIGTNALLLLGHGSIRKQIMGMSDAEPDAQEMNQMKKILDQGMREGAFGLSTGLYYTPGNFAKTDEVIELAKVVAAKGGIYDSHIRDESSYSIGLLKSIEESIEIARQAKIPVNISHIKALGVDVWGKSEEVIQMIEDARAEGLVISADQYPYRASGTSITNALVPRWVFADDFVGNMQNPELLPRILEEMKDNLRRRGGPEALLFTDVNIPGLYRKTLAEVAKERDLPVMKAAMDIIMSGGSRVASFNMNPDDMHNFMAKAWVMTSSDGSSGHPRKFGSFPKKIREFVLEKKIISLNEMIRKSTSLPAHFFQIENRGEIKVGNYADLILFKAEEVQDLATYEKPDLLAKGMNYVFVNGKIAIENGDYTEILAGKALRKKLK